MLEIRDIHKSFGENKILRGVSLAIEPGQCTALVGSNGCGKSTLMRIIAQTAKPDKGQILCQGKSVIGDRAFLRSRLGYVPQEDALAEGLSVRQQLDFWRKAVGSENREICALLDIPEIEKKPIHTLSGGQKKRLSIAMALQSSPEYLIMDEAMSSLDSRYKALLIQWLKNQLEKGLAILWCSHDHAELEQLCGKKLALRDGVAVEI